MIHFACPHCRTGLRARDEKTGKSTHCPKCRSPIVVPVAQDESAPSPASGASSPISDSSDLESSWEQQQRRQKTGLLMLSLFVSGLVCGTVLFVVLFFKIKEARLSKPVHPGHSQARPPVGRSGHSEPSPSHRFVPRAAANDQEIAGRPESAQAAPGEPLAKAGRTAKEEEYEAQPPKQPSSPALPAAMPSAATDDAGLRESEALVAPLVKDFQHHKVRDRLQAIEAVARLGPNGRAASRALCDALLDPNPRVRLAAALALDRVNPTLHRLVIPMLVDKELETRLECLRQLGRLGPAGSAAVPVVVYFKEQYLGGGLTVDVLAAIAPNDPSVTAKMAAWLTSDPDPYVRLAAVKALPHLAAAKDHVRALVQSLRTDPVDAVRAFAASALGDLGPDGRIAERALHLAKADASAQVREAAARALEKIQKSASGGR